VVDKRAGVPCAALPGREGDTLAGALLARFSEMSGVGFNAREPGLVHRLDTQTSGLVLAAKDQEAFDDLRAALSRGLVEKRYLAIVPAGVDRPSTRLNSSHVKSSYAVLCLNKP